MSQQGMRTFSTEFKEAVVVRLDAGRISVTQAYFTTSLPPQAKGERCMCHRTPRTVLPVLRHRTPTHHQKGKRASVTVFPPKCHRIPAYSRLLRHRSGDGRTKAYEASVLLFPTVMAGLVPAIHAAPPQT
jgi:hypothetical protein